MPIAAPAVITADTHTHPFRVCSRNGGADRREDGLSAFEQTLQFARERQCPWVHCGDWKHVRGTWDQESLAGLLRLMEQYRDVPKFGISGNGYHDGCGVKETGATGLAPFHRHVFTPWVTWRVVPGTDLAAELEQRGCRREWVQPWRKVGAVAFWPWQPTLDELPDFLEAAHAAGARLLIAHGFLREALVGADGRSLPDVGTPMEAFGLVGPRDRRVFDLAWFGDVHHRQILGDPTGKTAAMVCYPGSPYAQGWGEQETERGCWYFGPKGLEPLNTAGLPRFRVLAPKVADVPKLLNTDYPGDFVRLRLPAAYCAEHKDELLAFRKRSSARVFEIVPILEPKLAGEADPLDLEPGEIVSDDELLSAYMKAVPPPTVAKPEAILEAGRRLLK